MNKVNKYKGKKYNVAGIQGCLDTDNESNLTEISVMIDELKESFMKQSLLILNKCDKIINHVSHEKTT